MANNLMARFMNVPQTTIRKTNWAKNFRNITSADVGYGIPIMTDEIMANSDVSLDLRCAMFTNPTVAPLYSRFKMQVSAWWCPTSCYVPALRDSVRTDATTDYSFPVVNFDYDYVKTIYNANLPAGNIDTTNTDISVSAERYAISSLGSTLPYNPTGSIFSYLRMWPNNFSPLQFIGSSDSNYPKPLNAIPLLMYYDILRNYIINTQENFTYIRKAGYHIIPEGYDSVGGIAPVIAPIDYRVTRDDLDELFKKVRKLGSDYYTDTPWDITSILGSAVFGNSSLFPRKIVYAPKTAGAVGFTMSDVFNKSTFTPDYHYGLWRDTYINDFYNAFISDENVDYERNTAKIVVEPSETSSGEQLEMTMEQIRLGSMLQNFVRSHIFRNNAFDEYVDVEYGCKPARNLDKPMFLGAISSYMAFNDVISNAQTGDSLDIMDKEQIGSRAAVGEGHMFTGRYRGKDNKGNYERPFVKFHAPEPGYLMLILTIKPEVSYFEGYDPMYDKHSIFDLYRPSLRNIGYQDKAKRHYNIMPQLAVDATGLVVLGANDTNTPNIKVPGRPTNWSFYDTAIAHEPYGFEYMAKPNIITGQMTEIGTYLHWTNARSFNNIYDLPFSGEPFEEVELDPYCTTILPEMYHYIFANEQNIDNFQFFYDFDYNVYQAVPRTILSFK